MAAKEGATVCAVGRNEESLNSLKSEIGCSVIVADLTEEGQCERVVREATAAMNGLTSLVNCAGVLKGSPMDSASLENFMFNFNGNTKTVFEMMQHAIPHLKESGEGSSVVNISSVNGLQSFGGVASYCASKAAVDMLTRCAAVDLAPFKIRVNAVNPGVVVTNLQKAGGMPEEAYSGFLERSKTVTHPLAQNRDELCQPEDVANIIIFLLSEKSRWITGDNIKIDGGRACLGAR